MQFVDQSYSLLTRAHSADDVGGGEGNVPRSAASTVPDTRSTYSVDGICCCSRCSRRRCSSSRFLAFLYLHDRCRELDEFIIEMLEALLHRDIYRLFQITKTFVHRGIYRSRESVQSLRRRFVRVFLHSVEGASDGTFHVVHVSCVPSRRTLTVDRWSDTARSRRTDSTSESSPCVDRVTGISGSIGCAVQRCAKLVHRHVGWAVIAKETDASSIRPINLR